MRRLVRRLLVFASLAAVLVLPAGAQTTARPAPTFGLPDVGPFSGGVPVGQATAQPLPLTLADALGRGVQHNLAILTRAQEVESARGDRWRALSEVLPQISGRVAQERQTVDLAAFGFSGFPGVPTLVGPFNVFDARLFLSQSVVDANDLFRVREQNQALEAERHDYRNARDLVVLAVATLCVQALASDRPAASIRAQVDTAEALERLAIDRKQAGLVAGIDVLRAQVQLETERQRLILAENAAAKQKLALARAIGLPVGQPFTLADTMPYAPATVPALEQAMAQAYEHREDLRGFQARVRAAEEARGAARSKQLPSLHVDANYGDIGPSASTAVSTYAMTASVRVPLFNGGLVHAHVIEADATVRRRQLELDESRARVYYEVQAALLDVKAAEDQVEVAGRALSLAEQQLGQARDRFGAGIADTIEVVQAQEALAGAHDARIASLYAFNAAKAALAGALGLAEEEMPRLLGGSR